MTAAVGLITDPHQVESILTNGRAYMIFIGREFMRDPYWTIHAATVLGEDVESWYHLSIGKPGNIRFKYKLPNQKTCAWLDGPALNRIVESFIRLLHLKSILDERLGDLAKAAHPATISP